ncbi:hypothetical protein RUM44_002806 [Polyplax serrata]|uniref:Uncharacterized protein n=1 Tax=Polyplax serrata TaxID=468196 RepID=A0ABR1AFS7_POLSC
MRFGSGKTDPRLPLAAVEARSLQSIAGSVAIKKSKSFIAAESGYAETDDPSHVLGLLKFPPQMTYLALLTIVCTINNCNTYVSVGRLLAAEIEGLDRNLVSLL